MTEFFRRCPDCGRRFHVKLIGKKIIDLDREGLPAIWTGTRSDADTRPGILDIETIQYSYRCMSCGHEWSEKHVKEQGED